MPASIILASMSAIRAEMLENSGVNFTAKAARIDEEAIKQSLLIEGAKPRDVADALAEMKATRISQKNPEALVIGSDQVLDFDGNLISKPLSVQDARAQLQAMRGKKHSLFSAVIVMQNGRPLWRHVSEVRLWMRDFSDDYLDAYLDRNGTEILETVGCYKLESEGVRLFSKIEGDYFTVLGMPLVQLLDHLSETGVLEK